MSRFYELPSDPRCRFRLYQHPPANSCSIVKTPSTLRHQIFELPCCSFCHFLTQTQKQFDTSRLTEWDQLMPMTNNASGMCCEEIEEFVMGRGEVNVPQETQRLLNTRLSGEI